MFPYSRPLQKALLKEALKAFNTLSDDFPTYSSYPVGADLANFIAEYSRYLDERDAELDLLEPVDNQPDFEPYTQADLDFMDDYLPDYFNDFFLEAA